MPERFPCFLICIVLVPSVGGCCPCQRTAFRRTNRERPDCYWREPRARRVQHLLCWALWARLCTVGSQHGRAFAYSSVGLLPVLDRGRVGQPVVDERSRQRLVLRLKLGDLMKPEVALIEV